MEMYDEFKNEAWLCRVSAAFYGCVCTWKEPVSMSIAPLEHAARVGLGTGDIEFAMVSDKCCETFASLAPYRH